MRGVLKAIALGSILGLAMPGLTGSADANAADRVAPGLLQCDFAGYEGVLRYEEASKNERSVYALGMGFANHGTKDIHETMQRDFTRLDFDAVRAPIVSADVATGRLHVFDCATDQCLPEEIAMLAPLSCQNELGAERCMTFAVRVDGDYYCTLGPGLGH